MEGLASGALEAVIGVGRMDLADYHPHLRCDLDRVDCTLTVCLHLYHHEVKSSKTRAKSFSECYHSHHLLRSGSTQKTSSM